MRTKDIFEIVTLNWILEEMESIEETGETL